MSNFYQIRYCDEYKIRIFLNCGDSELLKKFNELNRNEREFNKFDIVLRALRENVATTTQYNWEADLPCGSVYAIKVNHHRFYTLEQKSQGYREYYICKYGKKETAQNSKKLTVIIESINNIEIKNKTKWIN